MELGTSLTYYYIIKVWISKRDAPGKGTHN